MKIFLGIFWIVVLLCAAVGAVIYALAWILCFAASYMVYLGRKVARRDDH